MILEIFRFLHFVGLAWGVGGATVASIISAKADKDREISSSFMKIVPGISKLIWIGIVLLIISGIGLSRYVTWPINKELLIVKVSIFALLIVIGIVIGFKINKMKLIAPKENEKPLDEFLKTKKQLKILSIISLVIWYAIVGISVFV